MVLSARYYPAGVRCIDPRGCVFPRELEEGIEYPAQPVVSSAVRGSKYSFSAWNHSGTIALFVCFYRTLLAFPTARIRKYAAMSPAVVISLCMTITVRTDCLG